MNENLFAMKDGGCGGVENSCPEKFFTLMDWLFLHLQQWKWTKSRARKNQLNTDCWGTGISIRNTQAFGGWEARKAKWEAFWSSETGSFHRNVFFVIHKHLFNIRTMKAVRHAERGFRNELDMGMTHGVQSKGGEMCSQPATEDWASCGLCYGEDSKTMRNGRGELQPEDWFRLG